MVYRGDQTCHICGEPTTMSCPACGRGVCEGHTLSGCIELSEGVGPAQWDRLVARLGDENVCAVCVERHLAESQGRFITIWKGVDAIFAEMTTEALKDAGFDARAVGTRTAYLIGASPFAFLQYVEVPEGQAEAAAALVRALAAATPLSADDGEAGDEERGEGDVDDEDEDEDEDEDDEDEEALEPRAGSASEEARGTAESPRRRRLVIGYVLFSLGVLGVGLAHFTRSGASFMVVAGLVALSGVVQLVRGLMCKG